jgi:hypothetical protein
MHQCPALICGTLHQKMANYALTPSGKSAASHKDFFNVFQMTFLSNTVKQLVKQYRKACSTAFQKLLDLLKVF